METLCIDTKDAKKYRDIINIVKAVGIILVGIGHFNPSNAPEYWVFLHKLIYVFHMPIFFVVSGVLYRLSGMQEYLSFLNKKIKRLLVPYVVIALIYLLIKLICGLFLTLYAPVTRLSVLNVLINPVNSHVPMLWFLYTLFWVFVLYPLLIIVFRSPLLLMIALIICNVIGVFANSQLLTTIIYYIPYFAFGVFLKINVNFTGRLNALVNVFIILLMCTTMMFMIKYQIPKKVYADSYLIISKYIFGLLGVMLVFVFSMLLVAKSFYSLDRLLCEIGKYTMSIYVFHTLFEAPFRKLIEKFGGGDVDVFLFSFVALCGVFSGVITPIILEKKYLSRFAVGRKYILGIN